MKGTAERGHICELQIHLRSFFDLKCNSHSIYKIVRSLQLEGATRAIPDATKIPASTRLAVLILLASTIVIGLLSSTIYRYHHWSGKAAWCERLAEDGTTMLVPNLRTAAFMFPFLLITYISTARLLRTLESQNKRAAALLQLM